MTKTISAYNERWLAVKIKIADINKPHSQVVAINCSGIGDDNDYSCFLTNCVIELYRANKKELALKLANTDPMLPIPFNSESLAEMVIRANEFEAKEKEREMNYYKNYVD